MTDGGDDQVDRMLAVAALVRSLLGGSPVVVGGVAEMFWTRLPYHPTDLDICTPLGPDASDRLRAAGFVREGRHWWHDAHGVADLYLDRLRQSTADDSTNNVEYQSLLAIASSCMDISDWPYVRRRIAAEPDVLREKMRRNHRAARGIARRAPQIEES